MHENRKHPRFRDTVMITYETVSDGAEPDILNELPCWLKELSEGGAMLQASKQLPIGARLLLHVMLPTQDSGDCYLKIHGEIRWENAVAEDGPWYFGVKFDALGEEDLGHLRQYIELRFSSTSLDTNNVFFE